MKAIKITQDIKDKNAKYQLNFVINNAVGTIVKRGFPNKFHVTEPVSGGYANRTDLHDADGWKEVVIPTYDANTQKLGTELIEVDNIFTYEVINLTQEEIDALADNNEDNEAELKLDVHVTEGEQLFRKCYKKIWRRRHKDRDATNKLTQGEARDLMEWFQPVYLWLKTGNWHQARKEVNKNALLNLITVANVTGMTNTFEWFKGEIEAYFTNDYDL